MKIIIPASGIGKRFADAGYKDVKPLIPVIDGKRIIDYVFDCFDINEDEFFILSSPTTYEAMDSHLKASGLKYHHIKMDGPKLGPVGAVMYVCEELKENISDDDAVIVSYCDYGMEWDYAAFIKYVTEQNVDGSIPCYIGYHPHLENEENVYAACKKLDDTDQIYVVKEKPK